MVSCLVPSLSLLRHLARLTRGPVTFPHASSLKRQRCSFSDTTRGLAKPSRRASSPRAKQAKEEIGASWASNTYRTDDWRQQRESLEVFADVLTSRWVAKDFREQIGVRPHIGLRSAPEFITTSFLILLKNGWAPAYIADWFSGTSKERVRQDQLSKWADRQFQMNELMQATAEFAESLFKYRDEEYLRSLADPSNMGQALYILGYQFVMSTNKAQRDLGEYMLKVAVLLHNRDATMSVLVSQYRRKSADEPAPQAFLTLNSLAKEGNDIGAMSLRAEMLMWPKKMNTVPTAAQRSEAHRLAQQAFEKSEAGPPIPPSPPPRISAPVACVPDVPTLPPWLILQRMGDPDPRRMPAEDLSWWKEAVEAGAREYDDPGACELAISPSSSIIPVGSADWIKFATKAAMAGKGDASFLLGQYYLEFHGWYPAKRTTRERSRIGFQWVEVSLSRTTLVPAIQERAFLMALLLRENGDAQSGMRWLEIGAERVDEVAKMKDADAEGCAAATRFFESCREGWHLPLSKLPPDWKVVNYFPDLMLKDAAIAD